MASPDNNDRKNIAAVVDRQRRIQIEIGHIDAAAAQSHKDADQAVQAGLRPHPAPPFLGQHLPKPGVESELNPPPEFMAPDYKGSGKFQDMVALVTGGDSGIGRAVAVLFAREGADVAIVYLAEDSDAEITKRCIENKGRRCLLVPSDVKDAAFCQGAVQRAVETFGNLDVLVNNAAFQEHATRIEDISEEHFERLPRLTGLRQLHYRRHPACHGRRNRRRLI